MPLRSPRIIAPALMALMVIFASPLSAQVGEGGQVEEPRDTVLPENPAPAPIEENLDAIIANAVAPALTEPVRVRSGMLTVKLEEAEFGSTLVEIGRQAGFEAIVSPEIAQKKLSTTFRDLDLHKGIQRMLSLISHRNFFIYYGRDDSITRIEVYSTDNIGKKPTARKKYTPTTGPSRPTTGVNPYDRTVDRSGTTRVGRQAIPPRRVSRSQADNVRRSSPVTRRSPDAPSDASVRGESDVPYIVPSKEPQYVPPYKRRR